jgi:hypothetical protein
MSKVHFLLLSLPEVLYGHLYGVHDAVVLVGALLLQLAVPTHQGISHRR